MEAPTFTAADDNGSGFNLTIENLKRETLLHVEGAQIRDDSRDGATRLYLKSASRDGEGDYVYLVDIEMYAPKREWIWDSHFLYGVFTKIAYRTEEETNALLDQNSMGHFTPDGPMVHDDMAAYRGAQIPAMLGTAILSPRRKEVA